MKLLALLRVGLSVCGLKRGEERGIGDRSALGEGEREGDLGKRSKGLGDLGGDPAGVESGDNSSISQYSKRISGVDCLLLIVSTSFSLASWTFLKQISVVMVFGGELTLEE